MNHQTTWTRKGKITARKLVFRSRKQADSMAQKHANAGRRVARSMHYVRNPVTAERSALYVVTIRPQPAWQKFAEKQRGHGVTGAEPSRAPTRKERNAAATKKANG